MKIDMSDLFDGEVDKLVEGAALEVTQKVTLDVGAGVVRGSPVDTGEFRGAWEITTPTKPFENGKIENATPYGPELVRGHSKQAPNGWIDNAILAATKLGGR